MSLTEAILAVFALGLALAWYLEHRRTRLIARFVAPQVAALVRRRGAKCALESAIQEVSVVCCDLRGYTAFCEAHPSQRGIELLREFYSEVGAAAAEFGGTIKDQAGDGVLILVGAPVAFDDHARRALALARSIRRRGSALAARWSCQEAPIGIGIGVASGAVSLGVIGAAARLEYAAVGPAVNIAARLCAQAPHGGLLLDERAVALLGAARNPAELSGLGPLQLKGVGRRVDGFSHRTRKIDAQAAETPC